MLKFNHVEARATKQAARQSVADTNEQKPDRPAFTVKVLDEGKEVKPKQPVFWLPISNTGWLKVVRDQRLHMDRRIHRIELYDRKGTELLAVFRRSTEAVRQ